MPSGSWTDGYYNSNGQPLAGYGREAGKRHEATEAAAELPKLLADLIRCTAKMAEAMGIDVAKAYVDRADQLATRWGR